MNVSETTTLTELVAIKKLLILQLLAAGYKQKHLAATLGVSAATLSRMLPISDKDTPEMLHKPETDPGKLCLT